MIQFNLLPDVKLEYIKAQRSRRLVVTSSVLVTIGAVTLLALLFGVGQLQKKHIRDLDKDIASSTSKLMGQPDINRVLTVQNQLASITELHTKKPQVSRFFGYLNQLTPPSVSMSTFSLDLAGGTVTVTGSAEALSSVNQYVDTLKYTAYQVKGEETTTPAFKDVVLSAFGLSAESKSSQPASYTVTFLYDPTILDVQKTVTLKVPKTANVRSNLQQNDLFQNAATATGTENKGTN